MADPTKFTKIAWSLWTQTIQALYTEPGLPYQLNHPLGPWTTISAKL